MIVDQAARAPDTLAWRGGSIRSLFALGLLAAAYVPLLAAHAAWLWESPNYGFALLLPPVILYLASDRLRRSKSTAADRPGLSLALAVLALILLAGAIFAWFPWLAAVSFIVLLSALIYGIGGSDLARTLRPVWLLLCLMLPLPFAFDQDLTVRLQSFAVTATGGLLDLFDVEHVREGNSLRLVDTTLFVSDACSGIHSFAVTLAATFAFIVWRRLGALRGMLLLSAAAVFVFVENVTRLTVVAMAWRAGHDLRSGRPHELLGIGLFATTILLVASAYRLLEFLAPSSADASAAGSAAVDARRPRMSSAANRIPWLTSSVVMVVLLLSAVACWAAAAPRIFHRETSLAIRFGDLQADALPAVSNEWKQTDYKFEPRSGIDPLAAYTYNWTYELDGLQVVVGLSHSYPGRHDLRTCYRQLGFQSTTDPKHADDAVEHPDGRYYVADFARPPIDHLLLYFDLSNGEGLTFAPEAAAPFARRFTTRLAELTEIEPGHGAADQFAGPYFHVQAVVRTSAPLTVEQREQVRDLFLHARRRLKLRLTATEPEP